MKLFGLRTWRELRGYTQRELAEKVGSTQNYISRLETGQRNAGPRITKRLAHALQVDAMELARPEGVRRDPLSLPAGPLGDLENSLRYAASQVQQAERRELTGRHLQRLWQDIVLLGQGALTWEEEGLIPHSEAVDAARRCVGFLDRIKTVLETEAEEARHALRDFRRLVGDIEGEDGIPSEETFGEPSVSRKVEDLAGRVEREELPLRDALRQAAGAA